MEDDPMGLGPEDQPDPEDKGLDPMTLGPDDFLPLVNNAINAQQAAAACGLPYRDSLLIMLKTYDLLLRLAIGMPLS